MASSSNNLSSDSEAESEQSRMVAGVVADYFQRNLTRRPSHNRPFSGWDNLRNLLGNENEWRCYENLRMRPYVFTMLCDTLVQEYGLKATPQVNVQEKVATFLMAVGIGQGNRQLQEFFQRSGYTITHNIREVLQACLHMSKDWIRRFDDPATLHPLIAADTRYYPFFKDCIGALDGTHIPARLPANEQIPFTSAIQKWWISKEQPNLTEEVDKRELDPVIHDDFEGMKPFPREILRASCLLNEFH